MPFIQISLLEGQSAKYIQALADGIHQALCTAWKIPEHDRFQTITEFKKTHFYIDKIHWDIQRSDNVVVIYITSIPRSQEMKKDLYQELVTVLGKNPGIRPEDIFVSIVNNNREDWSFGNGIAQMI